MQTSLTHQIHHELGKPDPNTEENREHLFDVENQVVNDLRRHTWDYVKSIGGLPIISDLP